MKKKNGGFTSRKEMSQDVRQSLGETAISYVVDQMILPKCSIELSNSLYQNHTTSQIKENETCIKKVTVKELKENGLFQDSKGFCKDEDSVIVYRYNDGENSEYKVYVSDEICNY